MFEVGSLLLERFVTLAYFPEFFVFSFEFDVLGQNVLHLPLELVNEGLLFLLAVFVELDRVDVHVVELALLLALLVRGLHLAVAQPQLGHQRALLLEFLQPLVHALQFDLSLLLAEFQVDHLALQSTVLLVEPLVFEQQALGLHLEVVEVRDEVVFLAELTEVLLLALGGECHLVGFELVVGVGQVVLVACDACHGLFLFGELVLQQADFLGLFGDVLLYTGQVRLQLLKLVYLFEGYRLCLVGFPCFFS